MFSDFVKFVRRGNVVDLAVAVVIGAAFSQIINSLVDDIINPIIAAIIGKPDLSDLTVTVGDATIRYGSFLNAVINFLIVAAAIFFLVVKPVQKMSEKLDKGEIVAETKACPECLSDIPVAATRCKFCGQEQPEVVALPA